MTDGSNGGPPEVPLTAKAKLECIRSIIERMDLTSPQKCIGVGIVVSADREWTAEVNTASLQQFASAKDRETVFRATKALDQKAIIAKAHGKGQNGKYTVLPPSVVEAIIEAYGELKSSRAKPDGITGPLPTGNAVGFDPTSPEKPVGFDPTSQKKVSPAPPSKKPLITTVEQEDSKLPPIVPHGDERVSFQNGQLKVFNGLRQFWLEKFGGDEKLDLALAQAAGYVQPNSVKPLEAQVSSQLAKMVRTKLDQDERYTKAVKTNSKANTTTDGESRAERWTRKMREIETKAEKGAGK